MNKIRQSFKMKVKKGYEEEYAKRHSKLWPEMKKLLHEKGITNYSIFLDEETNTLYGYQEVVGDTNSQELGELDIVKKWWKYMADIMDVNEDLSPVSIPLKEVFHLD